MTREYSSISVATTLNSGINTTATTMVLPSVGAATALLGGVSLAPANADIFTVAIDADTINEEIVYVTGVSGDTLTISRGQAGTGTPGVSGIAHNAGASIKHVLTSSDLIYFRDGVDNAVTLTGTQTLTNKTLTSPAITTGTLTTPTITGGTNSNSILVAPEERTTISATAATGTVNFDAVTQGVLYYTTNSSANWTLNIRGNSSTTLNSILTTGDAITVVFLATNGATAYYPTVYQVDGSAVTPKWQNGIAPTAGSASAIDAYSLTIIKTASATFTVLASQTKFA